MVEGSLLNKIVVVMGFQNVEELILKYALPITSLLFVGSLLTIIFLPVVPILIVAGVFVVGMSVMIGYPLTQYEFKKIDIDQNMHLFITYAGAISTLDIQRNILFKKIAEKEGFGELSDVSRKIIYLAKSWNLGFATACRKVSKLVPSKLLSDFLDRFAIMMDFGQSLQVFLNDEQVSVMDDYGVEYKKSLEKIRTIQEIFLSLTMAMAFMMSIGLLLPIIAQTDISSAIHWIMLAVVLVDVFFVIFVYNFIPADKLCHDLEHKDEGMRKVEKAMMYAMPIFTIVLIILVWFNFTSFIVSFSIAMIPLFYVGVIAQQEEEEVFKRDKAFPPFIRALGSGIEVRQGAIVSSLYALQVHDFGPLNTMVISLYRRLRTGNNKQKSWKLFGAETGSNLVMQFTNIFADAVSLGGSAEKIGEIISVNFHKLLSLRKLRLQLSSALRGALYGGMLGFAMSAYVAAQITQLLSNILSSPSSGGGAGNDLVSLVGSIAPTSGFTFDLDHILFIIGLMVIIHAFCSGIIIKLIEGGTMYACFFDICIMLWMGAGMGVALPFILEKLIPGLGANFGVK